MMAQGGKKEAKVAETGLAINGGPEVASLPVVRHPAMFINELICRMLTEHIAI
jgi:hypothetical protein